MRTDLFIARRLFFQKQQEENTSSKRNASYYVALWGMIIGVLIMIITIFIVVGFKQEIREKVIGFGAHIQVVNFDNNNTYEMRPIHYSDSLIADVLSVEGVQAVFPFATKPGMIKTDDAFQAIILKGVAEDVIQAEQSFFKQNIVAGRMPEKTNEVVLSQSLAQLLRLPLDTSFMCYFIQDNVRVRKYTLVGLYNTDFSEYDNLFMVGLLKQVQQLNGWNENQASGIEVIIDDFDDIDEITNQVYFKTANKPNGPYEHEYEAEYLYTQNICQTHPAIFSWLALLDMNVIIIIILMLAVAGICMCSGLIILILEGVQFIGVMKALGATNALLRRIYLWQAGFIIGKGMLIGNVLGVGLCVLQYFTHIIPLDPSAYYVSYVPISFAWGWWLLLNIGIFAVSMAIMLLPATLVAKISPAQSMKFE